MKKYLFILLTIAFAWCTAFSTLVSPGATTTFFYQKTTYAKSDVESVAPANWAAYTGLLCSGTNVKACTIVVDNIYTHLLSDGVTRVLNDATYTNHITIVVSASSPGVYYVNATLSTNISSVTNKN